MMQLSGVSSQRLADLEYLIEGMALIFTGIKKPLLLKWLFCIFFMLGTVRFELMTPTVSVRILAR